jgi:hypothetical protein
MQIKIHKLFRQLQNILNLKYEIILLLPVILPLICWFFPVLLLLISWHFPVILSLSDERISVTFFTFSSERLVPGFDARGTSSMSSLLSQNREEWSSDWNNHYRTRFSSFPTFFGCFARLLTKFHVGCLLNLNFATGVRTVLLHFKVRTHDAAFLALWNYRHPQLTLQES